MTTLRGYHLIIHEATDLVETAQLYDVEEIMRDVIFHSTLDWQTRPQLHAAAREAVDLLKAGCPTVTSPKGWVS